MVQERDLQPGNVSRAPWPCQLLWVELLGAQPGPQPPWGSWATNFALVHLGVLV